MLLLPSVGKPPTKILRLSLLVDEFSEVPVQVVACSVANKAEWTVGGVDVDDGVHVVALYSYLSCFNTSGDGVSPS